MKSIGFDNRNPGVFQLVTALDNPESEKNKGVSLDDFIDITNDERAGKEIFAEIDMNSYTQTGFGY